MPAAVSADFSTSATSTARTSAKRRDLIETLDDIAKEVSGIQANRCQALISAVLNWSVAEDLLEASPTHGITKRGVETVRNKVMTDNELRAFWNALEDTRIDDALRLLLLLGQRRDEVGRASAHEVVGGLWTIPGGLTGRTKNQLPHIVPLSPFALSLMRDGFNLYPTTLSHRFRDVTRGLGMIEPKAAPDDPDESRFRLHDLRHCCATGMARLRIPQEIRERVQNQVTGRRLTVGSRYDHHEYLDEKRAALAAWEAELLRIVGAT